LRPRIHVSDLRVTVAMKCDELAAVPGLARIVGPAGVVDPAGDHHHCALGNVLYSEFRSDCIGRIALDYCFTAFSESPDDSIWFENALGLAIAFAVPNTVRMSARCMA